jgi:hypothetical protein
MLAASIRRGLASAAGGSGESYLVRQARRRAILSKEQLPPVTGPVQGLWRQLLMREEMKDVRASVTEGLLKSLRTATPAAEQAGAAERPFGAEEFATAVPQAVPRALRLVWKREQRWIALRRRAHSLPERVADLRRQNPELAKTLASFVARHQSTAAGVNPLFGEATLRASVLPKRRLPPRDAASAYKQQAYSHAMDNLRLLLSATRKPASSSS